eukprot:GFKZ01014799.1.p2 GENE.GFKZ01014799.1~~GFKZ01014799.1.p2  ORF type:complete len:105 (-),score=8.27 GFKZ01014799.1:376-690(-)
MERPDSGSARGFRIPGYNVVMVDALAGDGGQYGRRKVGLYGWRAWAVDRREKMPELIVEGDDVFGLVAPALNVIVWLVRTYSSTSPLYHLQKILIQLSTASLVC